MQVQHVAAATAASTGAHQMANELGACVCDTHKGKQRGYGTINVEADPARDGTARWYIAWDNVPAGTHTTAIKETYLNLALLPSCSRRAPTALVQCIMVVLGNCKGREGVTDSEAWGRVAAVGAGQVGVLQPSHATAPPLNTMHCSCPRPPLLIGQMLVVQAG